MSRVAIYLPSLGGGGAERITVTLANAIAARGHQVDFLLAKREGPYLADVSPGIRIVDLGHHRTFASLLPLARYLRRERPEALLSGLNHANIVAILARMIAHVPTRLVVTEHNSTSIDVSAGHGRLVFGLMRWLYPHADRIVSVSRGIEKELAVNFGLPADKLCTIYNPLDVDTIHDRMLPRPDHPWLAAGTPPVVVAVGRLMAQKDYPTLLRAFALLRERRDARLVILGEGEERAALEKLIRELGIEADVALPGFEANPFAWMAASDLYVLSSAWEGLPGVLLEAMACGAKVVSTNCPTGPDEILEDGKWGALVPVGDFRAMAEAMNAALASPDRLDVAKRADAFRIEYAVDGYLRTMSI